MASNVLSALQEKVLTLLFDQGLGDQGYYLTGGTALAEFYLKHRTSEDLDFFTRKKGEMKKDFEWVETQLRNSGLTISEQTQRSPDFARYFVYLEKAPNEVLKIEFAKDAAAIMSAPTVRGSVVIDSLEDIAVNKVCAIFGRQPSEIKDFCDLYFILKESNYNLDYLLVRAREKEAAFDQEDAVLAFAIILRDVPRSAPLPRMLKPLNLGDMIATLVPMAEKIIRRLAPNRT